MKKTNLLFVIAFWALGIAASASIANAHRCDDAMVFDHQTNPPPLQATEAQFAAGLKRNLEGVKLLLEARGLTGGRDSLTRVDYKKVGALLGIETVQANSVFAGREQISFVHAAKLAEFLGVQWSDIALPDFVKAADPSFREATYRLTRPPTAEEYTMAAAENLALVLKELEVRGISIAQLASAVGTRQSKLDAVFAGQARFDLVYALMFANYFRVNPMDMMVPTSWQPGKLQQALVVSRSTATSSVPRKATPLKSTWTTADFEAGTRRNFERAHARLLEHGILTQDGRGVSYRNLARLLFLDPEIVRYCLKEQKQPDILQAAQLARIMDVDLAELAVPDFIRQELRSMPQTFRLKDVDWTPSQFVRGLERNMKLVSAELRARGISAFKLTRLNGLSQAKEFLDGTLTVTPLAALGLAQVLHIDPMLIMTPGFFQPGRLELALAATRVRTQ